MANNVQSVIMKRQYWTLAGTKKWLKAHNFKFLKVDVMPCYLWLRQLLPKRYKTLGWCQQREKSDWQEGGEFDCRLVQTIFIFCCPSSIFTRHQKIKF